MDASTTHRRDFARALALGALAAPSVVAADEPEKKPDEPKPAAPPRTEVDARMDLILARYGGRLDDEARKSIRSELEGIVRRAETLRKLPLDNGDSPSHVFTPYRAPLA